jgi:hypothetical protein
MKGKNILTKLNNFWSTRKGKITAAVGGAVIVAAVIFSIATVNFGNSNSISAEAAKTSSNASTSSLDSSDTSSSEPATASSDISAASSETTAKSSANIAATSVDFTDKSIKVLVGATYQLTAKITPSDATDKTLTWTSEDTGIATVSNTGIVVGKAVGTVKIHATNTDGQRDTCTVTVFSSSTTAAGASTSASKSTTKSTTTAAATTGTNTTKAATSTTSHVANYQGVNETKTYTDEITGITQTVRFAGVGAGYKEVAGGSATLNTTAAMGAAHGGFNATAILSGTSGYSKGLTTAVVGKAGTCTTFTFDNLTAGTYTLKLTASDGTVVARYSFTVDSSGNVK